MNHVSVAPETAPISQLIGIARKSRVRALRPEAVNRATWSETVLTHSNEATAVLEHDGRGRTPVMSLFDHSTAAEPADIYLGRSVHPGYLDLPFVTEEVLANGHHDFGGPVAIVDLSPTELRDLEKQLNDYERDFKAQIKAMRHDIEERVFALDVTGQLPLGIAA